MPLGFLFNTIKESQMKKLPLALAAFGLMMFTACGDDSSIFDNHLDCLRGSRCI